LVINVLPILTLAVLLQGEAQGPVATAPTAAESPADDPIGALVEQADREPSAPAIPAIVSPAPVAAPTASPNPSPGPALPVDEDEDAAETLLPRGPQPYTSLPPSSGVRPNPTLFNNPMVRLRPAPTGALDGGWVLSRADGKRLYGFQFNDTGGGSEIEGAWRDLGREWSTLGSGPVLSVGYEGAGVTIRFFERGRTDLSVIQLQRTASGDWTGELQSKGAATTVLMTRN